MEEYHKDTIIMVWAICLYMASISLNESLKQELYMSLFYCNSYIAVAIAQAHVIANIPMGQEVKLFLYKIYVKKEKIYKQVQVVTTITKINVPEPNIKSTLIK